MEEEGGGEWRKGTGPALNEWCEGGERGLFVFVGGVVRLFRCDVRGEPEDGAQGKCDETGDRINGGRWVSREIGGRRGGGDGRRE